MNWVIKSFEELTNTELYKILKLRSEVFVLEQKCLYQDLDEKDYKAFHIFSSSENRIIAYARIFKPGDYFEEASIGRVCSSFPERNKSLGRTLMLHSIEFIKCNIPTDKIRISAQEYLLQFYERLGFEIVGNMYLEDEIPHRSMILKL